MIHLNVILVLTADEAGPVTSSPWFFVASCGFPFLHWLLTHCTDDQLIVLSCRQSNNLGWLGIRTHPLMTSVGLLHCS